MDINLLPVARDPKQLASYLQENFRRIVDALRNVPDERIGVSSVTGSLVVATGLTKVQFVIASLYDNMPGDASIIGFNARPDTTAGSILLKTWKWGNTWTPSIVVATSPINISWVAYGF